MEKDIINKIIDSPKIIGIIADIHQGKSNCAYYLIEVLKENYKFNLYTFGLKLDVGDLKIYSVEELETIKNGFIIIDEYFTLFNLIDRHKKEMIERTLRLIYHNNNILILMGVPENFKKFISNKINMVFYGKCTIGDFIRGSNVKNFAINYKGVELGSSVLDMPKGTMLFYDGEHYSKVQIPYLISKDTKRNNKPICEGKRGIDEKVSVQENVEKEK